MMLHLLTFLTLLIGMTSLRAGEPRPRTLATELPSVPQGVNPAIYPMPRTQWAVNVERTIREGQLMAEKSEVILDGDSITAGWRRFWKVSFGAISAFNFAQGGDRTEHLLWRLEQGQVENFKPKLILLMIGTNNLTNGEAPAAVAQGVEAVVKAYRQRCPEAKILLQGVLPRAAQQAKRVAALNAQLSLLDDGESVFYVDLGKSFTDSDGNVRTDLLPDSLHPNEEGYKIWATGLAPHLEKHLQSSSEQ